MSNFRPHDYADVLRQEDTYASDSSVMYRWNKVHWEPLDEKFCERLAYEWLVRHDIYGRPQFAKH
ncbi:hypothetical protein AAKU64_004423 [Undibacterium sp. GrIS 1.8]|uniref:hypothetical protein n=1 Tax=unclassified Undibacterium TaxID=2630295 RepID=UPI0033993245